MIQQNVIPFTKLGLQLNLQTKETKKNEPRNT